MKKYGNKETEEREAIIRLVANYTSLPIDAVERFLGAISACGYELAPKIPTGGLAETDFFGALKANECHPSETEPIAQAEGKPFLQSIKEAQYTKRRLGR